MEFIKHKFETNFFEIQTNFDNKQIVEHLQNNLDIFSTLENQRTTYFNIENILQLPEFNELKDFLSIIIFQFVKNFLNKEKITFNKSWFQFYKEGNNHICHTHGYDVREYSLIFYINVTKDSSKTVFHPPLYPYIHGFNNIYIEPQNNKLVIFPSYLAHTVLPNNDNERIILSANFTIDD